MTGLVFGVLYTLDYSILVIQKLINSALINIKNKPAQYASLKYLTVKHTCTYICECRVNHNAKLQLISEPRNQLEEHN